MDLRTGIHRMLLLAALCAAAAPRIGAAQGLLGSVLSEDGTPIVGALLSLEDGRGVVVSRLLSGPNGGFLIQNVPRGPYDLHVQMIGHRTETLELVLGGDSVVTLPPVTLRVQPFRLEGIAVDAAPVCSLEEAEGLATYQVWDEAKKALGAAQVTSSRRAYRFDVRTFVRYLHPQTRTVSGETFEDHAFYSADPFRSLPADEIEFTGYVRVEGDTTSLYGPNTDLFLSSGFEGTHCFSLEEGRDDEIGLRFEVKPGRAVSDIEGVLWLDRASAELRRLEFEYRNLPRSFGVGRHGGRMEYQRLDGGFWIVRKWSLYSPLREEGGEVTAVLPPAGRLE